LHEPPPRSSISGFTMVSDPAGDPTAGQEPAATVEVQDKYALNISNFPSLVVVPWHFPAPFLGKHFPNKTHSVYKQGETTEISRLI